MPHDLPVVRDLLSATERMKRLALAVLGNEHDAEDAAQDAWIRALGMGDAARDSDAWLAGVARNVARERRRTRSRRRLREERASPREAGPPDQIALDQLDALHTLVQVVRSLEEPYDRPSCCDTSSVCRRSRRPKPSASTGRRFALTCVVVSLSLGRNSIGATGTGAGPGKRRSLRFSADAPRSQQEESSCPRQPSALDSS